MHVRKVFLCKYLAFLLVVSLWYYTIAVTADEIDKIEKTELPIKLVLILFNRFDSSQYQLSIPFLEMHDFITGKLDLILKQEVDRFNRHQSQVRTLKNLHFPFPFRKYQENIIDEINQALNDNLNLMIEAHSGLGKTVV